MEFKQRTLMQLADMICGNFKAEESFFRYRSSSYLTEFFQDCDTDYAHDGSTRRHWVAETLRAILAEPHANGRTPPETFSRVIRVLMDKGDATKMPSAKGRLQYLAPRSCGRVSNRFTRLTNNAVCATLGQIP
jgi:hypothetical protein